MSSNSHDIGKNIWYASLSTFVPALFTFLFWFVTAKFVGPYAIGTASTFASATMILSGFVILDTNLGMKRYLGIARSQNDLKKFKHILISTSFFIVITMSIILLFFIFSKQSINFIGIDQKYLWSIIILLPALSFQQLLSEALISLLKSKNLLLPQLIGSIIRFPILFSFIFFIHLSLDGTIIAYSIFFIICSIFYAFDLYKLLKNIPIDLNDFFNTIRNILTTGLSSWLPHIISIIGSQLSIIAIFTIEGSVEAGKFYLPMAIFSIAMFIVSGITRVGHPLVAGMDSEEKQKDFVSNTLRFAFIITIPLTAPFLFFSSNYMGILGEEYISAGGTLSIFMAGLSFSIITEIFYYYEYSLGRKRSLLLLGLAGNIPRVLLYFILIPEIGQLGGAMAYTIGTFIQLSYSLILSKKYGLRLVEIKYLYILIIPYGIGILLWYLNFQFVISSTIIVFLSIILYIKFNIIQDKQVNDLLYIILPNKLAKIAIPKICKFIKILK